MTDEALCAHVRVWRSLGRSDEQILEKFGKHGMTPAHLAAKEASA